MKFNTNIDKCELFGTTPQNLMEYVSKVSVGDVLKREGYTLTATQTDGFVGMDRNTSVTYSVRIGDNELGKLTFKSSRRYKGVWTFRVDNRVFYTSFWEMPDVNSNSKDCCSDIVSVQENPLQNIEYKVPIGDKALVELLSKKRLSNRCVAIYPQHRYSAFGFIPLILDDLCLNLKNSNKIRGRS
ncbi:MAG: hypothetical protein J1F40_02315 [Prevotellaceae bacterium]|nr:hypothetical protein [Prevotellaceae bacterium]